MRLRFSILFFLLNSFVATTLGQCIIGDALLKEIQHLNRDTSFRPEKKAKHLSLYDGRFAACAKHFDSTHAKLWRIVARIYLDGSDFPKAIRFSERSIAILSQLSKTVPINKEELLPAYFVLGDANESLYRAIEKMSAVDSCISISMNLKSNNPYYLWALLNKAVYFFDIGDYYNCLQYSKLCEALTIDYCKRDTGLQAWGNDYIESSLVWQVNALTLLRKYDDAKAILQRKVEEVKHAKSKLNLGVIYGLLGEVLQYKGEFREAFIYHKLSMELELLNKHAFNYKSGLNYFGYEIYFKYYKDFDKALKYYHAALNYTAADLEQPMLSPMESLNIYNRMGMLYSAKQQYDSALKYIQSAFDQIKPGITESDLLNIPLDQFINNRRLGFIANLIIDKAEIFCNRYVSRGDRRNLQEAVRIYKIADQFLEKTKTEQSHPKSKLFGEVTGAGFMKALSTHVFQMVIL